MILINMDIPGACCECPCSYWIQTGPESGKLMCNVKEHLRSGDVLVENHYHDRPEDCPMIKVELHEK